jgi:hypothetical protein
MLKQAVHTVNTLPWRKNSVELSAEIKLFYSSTERRVLMGNDHAVLLYSSPRMIASVPLPSILLRSKQAVYFTQRCDVTYIQTKQKNSVA